MSLRLACDLDGTLADMEAALQREADRLFGPRPDTGLSDGQRRRLWAHVEGVEDFWLTLPEIEAGAVARLAALRALHGWEVIFLTQRPPTAGGIAQLQSQRWLEAHGFELPSVYVMNGSRGAVAAALALDAVVDDRPENCLDVVTDSKARAFLVWRDDPALMPPAVARLGIEPVTSFAEALAALEAMTRAAAPEPRRLLDRVRSAIGI